jgi:hypothetical protein
MGPHEPSMGGYSGAHWSMSTRRNGSPRALATRRIVDGLAGVGELYTLMAAHAEDPAQVAVGIETDRGLLVGALQAAGYHVYAVNPHAVSRYRGRHGSSRGKSDRADAKVLADLVRTTGTTTARSPGTARWWRRSRCWPGRTRAQPASWPHASITLDQGHGRDAGLLLACQ